MVEVSSTFKESPTYRIEEILFPGSDEEQENMVGCEAEGELSNIDSLINSIKYKESNQGCQKTMLERLTKL